MGKVAVTYSPQVGGSSVISLKESFKEVGSQVIDADFRQLMADIPQETFTELYASPEGRQQLFAHAKAKANEFLENIDCLALSGSVAMLDPQLFNKARQKDARYDFSRTIAELALLHVATEKGMPILGICGGHHVLAVYGGGEVAELSATNLSKQRYYNYDKIKINKNSLLADILFGKPFSPVNKAKQFEDEFFGGHYQFVSKLGKDSVATAIASDGESNEGSERQFGAPTITTQFHPEVSAKGIPKYTFFYEGKEHQIEACLHLFDYFNKAGEAYRKKQGVMAELQSLKPTDENQCILPSSLKKNTIIAAEICIPKKNKTNTSPWILALKISFVLIGMLLSTLLLAFFPPAGMLATLGIYGTAAVGAGIGGLGAGLLASLSNPIKILFKALFRKTASDVETNKQLEKIKKMEATKEESSYSNMLPKVASPAEILLATQSQAWEKVENTSRVKATSRAQNLVKFEIKPANVEPLEESLCKERTGGIKYL